MKNGKWRTKATVEQRKPKSLVTKHDGVNTSTNDNQLEPKVVEVESSGSEDLGTVADLTRKTESNGKQQAKSSKLVIGRSKVTAQQTNSGSPNNTNEDNQADKDNEVKDQKAQQSDGDNEVCSETVETQTPSEKNAKKKRKSQDNREFMISGDDVDNLIVSIPIKLKGIYPRANFKFRVQINSFFPDGGKISRNLSDLRKALWVYEILLMIGKDNLVESDNTLDKRLKTGNYSQLVQLSTAKRGAAGGEAGGEQQDFYFFANALEFFLELGRWLAYFAIIDTDVLSSDFINQAVEKYNAMRLEWECSEIADAAFEDLVDLTDAHAPLYLPNKDSLRKLTLALNKRQSLKDVGLDVLEMFGNLPFPEELAKLGVIRESQLSTRLTAAPLEKRPVALSTFAISSRLGLKTLSNASIDSNVLSSDESL
jgi:hypothetical protein